MAPTEKERQRIDALIAEFERSTGIQAVAVVTSRADAYPDIPWKAYAIGSGLGAIAAALNPFFVQGWSHASVIALDAMLILSGGVVLAVLATFVPAFARLFLDRVRAEGEALQYAEAMFLERELFRTRDRRAVLVVLCCFERVAVVLVDKAVRDHAPAAAVAEISRASGASLRQRGIAAGFETAFGRLADELKRNGFVPAAGGSNDIADEVVVEEPR